MIGMGKLVPMELCMIGKEILLIILMHIGNENGNGRNIREFAIYW